MNKIETFVINLKQDSQKKQHMENLANMYSLSFRFIEAIYGKEIDPNTIEQIYSKEKAKSHFGRTLTPGEIGCALSHRVVYETIIKENIPWALILEDDICFEQNFQEFIKNIDKLPKDAECVLLGHHGPFNREDESAHSLWFTFSVENFKLIRFSEKSFGTYAYLISAQGCKKLLDETSILIQPIDHYTGSDTFLNLYGASPQLAKIAKEFAEESTISSERTFSKKSDWSIIKEAALKAFSKLKTLKPIKKYSQTR